MPTTYAIPDGRTAFDATTYTGTGSTRTVTNSGGFQPDLVWIKNRTGVYNHRIFDSIRGVTKILYSNATDAEVTDANSLTAFNSNGFSLGSAAGTNNNTDALVGWQWKAGGTAVSNTSGTITSSVSANPTAGFSVVTYTGTGAAATIGHGLGVAPKMIICKARGATGNWVTYHTSIGAGNVLFLDLVDASASSTAAWNNTTPTSSVFSVAASANSNPSGVTAVAYCWSEIDGFSKFGSYTGNGSTDGPFIYTGFRPKFVIWKITNYTGDWQMMDTSVNSSNASTRRLFPNLSNAEATNASVDFLSNGFKVRDTNSADNFSGGTYIYMAFAENPFKYANAR